MLNFPFLNFERRKITFSVCSWWSYHTLCSHLTELKRLFFFKKKGWNKNISKKQEMTLSYKTNWSLCIE